MNELHENIAELQSKTAMYQSLLSALTLLDEWNFESERITEAIRILKTESKKMDLEIDGIMGKLAGGNLNIDI